MHGVTTKHKLFCKYGRAPSELNKEAYRTCQNNLNSSIRRAKRHYAESLLSDCSNARQQWQALNELPQPYSKRQTISLIQIDGNQLSNPSDIANAFINYFMQITPKFSSTIQAEPYSSSANKVSTNLLPNELAEITKIMRHLWNSAAGCDYFRVDVLKYVREIIAIPLSKLINLSFKVRIFPSALKKAVVSPIYRAKKREDLNNCTNRYLSHHPSQRIMRLHIITDCTHSSKITSSCMTCSSISEMVTLWNLPWMNW